jgi:hypothetical protein
MIVREATLHDVAAIRAMRARNERPFIGYVEIPANVTWFVACNSHPVACAAVNIGPDRKVVITDLHDDGSFAGRRGLVALLGDAFGAHATLFVSVPFDRPELRTVLERRGFVFKAWHGEFHSDGP